MQATSGDDGGTAKAEQELLLLWSAVQRDHAEACAPDPTMQPRTELSSAAQTGSHADSSSAGVPLKGSNPFHNGNPAGTDPQQDAIAAELGRHGSDPAVLRAAHESLAPYSSSDLAGGAQHGADAHSYGPRLCEPHGAGAHQRRGRGCCAQLTRRWRASLGPEHEPLASAPAAQSEELYRSDASFVAALGRTIADSARVFASPERAAAVIAVLLAFFNQIAASTSIINYAPEVFERVGVTRDKSALMYSALIAAAKTVGSFGGAAPTCGLLLLLLLCTAHGVSNADVSGALDRQALCRHGASGRQRQAAAPAVGQRGVRLCNVRPLPGPAGDVGVAHRPVHVLVHPRLLGVVGGGVLGAVLGAVFDAAKERCHVARHRCAFPVRNGSGPHIPDRGGHVGGLGICNVRDAVVLWGCVYLVGCTRNQGAESAASSSRPSAEIAEEAKKFE